MSVTLTRRLRTLLRADAHGVVESLEERSLLLKQHLREAEIELGRKRARLEALAEEEKRIGEELERVQKERDAADADAALAIDQDNEELARFALRKWIPLRDQAESLVEERRRRGEERETLAARIELQEQNFDALRRRIRAELAQDRDREDAEAELWPAPTVADEEIELELLRRRREGEPS